MIIVKMKAVRLVLHQPTKRHRRPFIGGDRLFLTFLAKRPLEIFRRPSKWGKMSR